MAEEYTNSSLVDCVDYSPNHSGERTHCIDRITPHCVVGQLSAESIGACFESEDIQASCNYGIGYDGRIVLVVDEANRSWCSSSRENDQRAVTIECASDTEDPYEMTDEVYDSLIDLCTDICQRNGKSKLLWLDDEDEALDFEPDDNEMLLTVHRWFENKSCPGDWLVDRLSDLAAQVTSRLGGTAGEDNSDESEEESSDDDEESNTVETNDEYKKEYPSRKCMAYAGPYEVTAVSGLNLRDGVLWNHNIVTVIPYGTRVINYGYYTPDPETGKLWLFVAVLLDGVKYEGFVHSSYLKRLPKNNG